MAAVTARQRVLAYIKRGGGGSAAQIGRGLNMSVATVRHHLAILVADGRITAVSSLPVGGRGRPQKLYRLSDSMLGDNLAAMADVLLSSWLDGLDAEARQAALKSIAEGLAQRMGEIEDKLPPQKRLVQLVERLDQHHYQARWEAGADGPRILFGRCPYSEIIDQHPELCRVDAHYLSGALNADVEQRSKIDRKGGQVNQCAFAVRRLAKGGD